jgi:hypothetical protein
MKKILFHHKEKKVNAIVISSLVVSIIISSFFILYSPDQNIRNYNALLMSAISIGIALIICLAQVLRYKKGVRKQRSLSKIGYDKQSHRYYDNNKMHFSICLFLGLWLAAQLMWLSQYEEAILWFFFIADAFFFIGYASFGYFLYNLYFHFFRNEFDPFVLVLIGVIIVIVLFFILYLIVTISYTDLVYPVLDAIMVFPALLIFLAVVRKTAIGTDIEEQRIRQTGKNEEKELSSSTLIVSPIWLLLLSSSMILSAVGDIGYAYSTALGPDIVLRDVWMWNIIFNADHLCIAAALIGYRHFFSFNRVDTMLQH